MVYTDNDIYNLLDGAAGDPVAMVNAADQQQKVAADPTMPLDKRLEAFEDIFESEVGDTSLVRARNIEREVGLRQIYLKFEGGNPTGTQKDRIAFAQAMDALRRGFDTITVATCGNYGVAMALAAKFAGLRSLIFIPEKYHPLKISQRPNRLLIVRNRHLKAYRVKTHAIICSQCSTAVIIKYTHVGKLPPRVITLAYMNTILTKWFQLSRTCFINCYIFTCISRVWPLKLNNIRI